jgi:hypothetical protein
MIPSQILLLVSRKVVVTWSGREDTLYLSGFLGLTVVVVIMLYHSLSASCTYLSQRLLYVPSAVLRKAVYNTPSLNKVTRWKDSQGQDVEKITSHISEAKSDERKNGGKVDKQLMSIDQAQAKYVDVNSMPTEGDEFEHSLTQKPLWLNSAAEAACSLASFLLEAVPVPYGTWLTMPESFTIQLTY